MIRALALLLLGGLAGQAMAQEIVAATYSEPTNRYPHGALGDDLEWGLLTITLEHSGHVGSADAPLARGTSAGIYELRLPEELVFEDTEPRLWDVTGDGAPEVVLIQSHRDLGARLVIMGLSGPEPVFLAATEFIGQSNRWLAPVGAADLEGDGRVEIAYVDRPHLAKLLRVVEMRPDGAGWALADEAAAPGFTNHRFGSPVIEGGVFDCGQGPEIITADADWQRVLATRLQGRSLVSRDLGAYAGAGSLTCR